MRNPDWQEDLWLDARSQARKDMGLADGDVPESCPWTMELVAHAEFWPE